MTRTTNTGREDKRFKYHYPRNETNKASAASQRFRDKVVQSGGAIVSITLQPDEAEIVRGYARDEPLATTIRRIIVDYPSQVRAVAELSGERARS